MSLDIIDIALDKMTDAREFEMMASELMREAGYPTIEPLGGTGDLGRDAVEDRYYENKGRMSTVFQYTLQEYLPQKIEDTIAKLERNRIVFQKLVIVTPKYLSSERIEKLKETARKKHALDIDIFSHERLRNQLSNYDNGIFHRHFPDIDRQILDFKQAISALPTEGSSELERAMLRSSLCFTLAPGAQRTRNTLFDNLVCGLLAAKYPNGVTIDSLLVTEPLHTLKSDRNQITASIERLMKNGMAVKTGGAFRLSAKEAIVIGGQASAVEATTNALVSDAIQRVEEFSRTRLSDETIRLADRNIRAAMITVFRLYGIDIAANYDNAGTIIVPVEDSEIITTLRRQLDKQTAATLISVMADIFAKPTPEQADVIAKWCRGYLGLRIMNVDPMAAELQITRLKSKVFVLDTDFLLDCVVKELPTSSTALKLVRSLLNSGCRVIVPDEVVPEAITHAEISPKTYQHFGAAGLGMPDAYIQEKVHNAFAKGYFFGVNSGQVSASTSFDKYRKNYYDASEPDTFFREVLSIIMPKGTEFLSLASLLKDQIAEDATYTKLYNAFLEEITGAFKAGYRYDDENKCIAQIDTQLFLTVLTLNPTMTASERRILRGTAYLITQCGRFRRIAPRVGLPPNFVVRPESIAGTLDILLGYTLSPGEMVAAMSNPFMTAAVDASWKDVCTLVQSGVDTRDKSVARLRRDIDESLHVTITEIQREDDGQVDERKSDLSSVRRLIDTAKTRGYRIAKDVEKVITTIEALEASKEVASTEVSELKSRLAAVESKFGEFGKRKEKHLRRVAGSQGQKS